MKHDWKITPVKDTRYWNTDTFHFFQCTNCKTFMISPKNLSEKFIERFCSSATTLNQAIFKEIKETSCAEIIMQQIIE